MSGATSSRRGKPGGSAEKSNGGRPTGSGQALKSKHSSAANGSRCRNSKAAKICAAGPSTSRRSDEPMDTCEDYENIKCLDPCYRRDFTKREAKEHPVLAGNSKSFTNRAMNRLDNLLRQLKGDDCWKTKAKIFKVAYRQLQTNRYYLRNIAMFRWKSKKYGDLKALTNAKKEELRKKLKANLPRRRTLAEVVKFFRDEVDRTSHSRKGSLLGRLERSKTEVVNLTSDRVSKSLYKFIEIYKNIRVTTATPNAGPKPTMACNCVQCGPTCPCAKGSIAGGAAFIYKNQLFRDHELSYWTSAVKVCSEECSCKGCCDFGIKNVTGDMDLQVFTRDKILGFGLRTIKAIAPGQVVVFFKGEIVSESDLDKGTTYAWNVSAPLKSKGEYWDTAHRDIARHFKCSEKGRNLFIEPKAKGNIGRFVTHSANPNLQPIRLYTNDTTPESAQLVFYATRWIPANGELFVDYGDGYIQDHLPGVSCLCGDDLCAASDVFDLRFSDHEIKQALEEKDNYIEEKNMLDTGLLHMLNTLDSQSSQTLLTLLRAQVNRKYFFKEDNDYYYNNILQNGNRLCKLNDDLRTFADEQKLFSSQKKRC